MRPPVGSAFLGAYTRIIRASTHMSRGLESFELRGIGAGAGFGCGERARAAVGGSSATSRGLVQLPPAFLGPRVSRVAHHVPRSGAIGREPGSWAHPARQPPGLGRGWSLPTRCRMGRPMAIGVGEVLVLAALVAVPYWPASRAANSPDSLADSAQSLEPSLRSAHDELDRGLEPGVGGVAPVDDARRHRLGSEPPRRDQADHLG